MSRGSWLEFDTLVPAGRSLPLNACPASLQDLLKLASTLKHGPPGVQRLAGDTHSPAIFQEIYCGLLGMVAACGCLGLRLDADRLRVDLQDTSRQLRSTGHLHPLLEAALLSAEGSLTARLQADTNMEPPSRDAFVQHLPLLWSF